MLQHLYKLLYNMVIIYIYKIPWHHIVTNNSNIVIAYYISGAWNQFVDFFMHYKIFYMNKYSPLKDIIFCWCSFIVVKHTKAEHAELKG